MIFDSVYNPFRGVEAYFKIINGEIKKGQAVKFMATKMEYHADEIGALKLAQFPKDILKTGEVGYIISGINTMNLLLKISENPLTPIVVLASVWYSTRDFLMLTAAIMVVITFQVIVCLILNLYLVDHFS